ncbi:MULTISPECIES: DUF4136 domain-containing protein [Comamonas]|uniref:DUF4136 domain-containing protein n=1 Tax=Comamonas TaxID=283 RepID=UPI00050EF5CE|nr:MULTISPECIES: DUF4136 domain-containing protein [Comamonas]KGG91302.1 hypothetical protein P369_12105 [Comamonas thiooxydans]KGG96915.1 hypothetical protein P367_17315 [Comamonas thiooxydans]KGH05436.1 hypothetical protein P365_09310 [Comamonas thiooxydans]KGH13302.1 hypothetical protein P368_08960 [Comamonas thiooxydans]TZG11448.1 DUF4136 domain-containing protein [Comamonas thiooxydans]
MNLRKTSLRWIGLAALTATALLAGCSTVREVNSTVQSFSALNTIPVPATYRLETLPSQQGQVNFAAVEAQAQHALARVGLTRDDSHASLVVQISAMARYARDYASWPYYDPYWGPRWGWGMSYGRGFGWGFGGGMMFNEPPLEYYRAVSIVMRDIKTQQIVYETSAQRQDVWTDDPAIFGILFDAALTGFPKPPQGQRNVRTVIQPQAAQPANGAPAAPAQPAASVTPAAPANVAPATVAPAR